MDIHCVTRNLGRRSLAQTWVDGLALAGVHLAFLQEVPAARAVPRASTASREIFSPCSPVVAAR